MYVGGRVCGADETWGVTRPRWLILLRSEYLHTYYDISNHIVLHTYIICTCNAKQPPRMGQASHFFGPEPAVHSSF